MIIIVVLGLATYTHTAHFHQLLHDQLITLLQNSLDAEVSFTDVGGSVWQGLEMRALSIRKDGVEVISLERATVTVDILSQALMAWRTSSFHITGVTLTGPVMHLVQDPETGWNVAHLLKPVEPGPEQSQVPLPLRILLQRLTVEKGQIFIRLADGKEFQVTECTLDGALSLLPAGVQANVSAMRFALAGAGLPAMHGRSRLAYVETGEGGKLTLQPLELRSALSHVEATGVVNNLTAPILALTVTIEKLAAADLGVVAPRLQEDVRGSVRLTGPLSTLQINAAFEAPHGRVSSDIIVNLAQTPPQAQGEARLHRVAVHKVLQLPDADMAGEVSGHVTFQGAAPQTARAESALYVGGLVVKGKSIGDVNLTAELMERKVAFLAEVKGHAGYLYSHGHVSFGEPLVYETNLMVRSLDAKQVIGDSRAPLTNVNMDVWVKGQGITPETMETAAKVVFAPSVLGSTTISSGEFTGTLHHGQLTVTKGTLLANDTTVDIQGRVGALRKTTENKISYHVFAKNLTPWLALTGVQGKGTLDLKGTAAGALTALQLDGAVSFSHAAVGTAEIREGALVYRLVDLGSPHSRGQITAMLNGVQTGRFLKSVQAEVNFTGLQPADIQTEVTVEDDASRTHRLKTQARYTSEQLNVLIQDLALQLPRGMWRTQTAQPPQLVLRGGVLSIERFVLTRAGQTISAAGTFDSQGPVHLQLRVDRFALEEASFLFSGGPAVSGVVNADVAVQGTLASPDVTGRITSGPLTVAEQTYAGLTAQAVYRGERLDLNILLKQDHTHALVIEGGIPVSRTDEGAGAPVLGEANLRIHSDGLSLAFLALLSREIQDVQGAVSMDVTLRGPVQSLAPSGAVRLQHGSVMIKQLGQTFSDIAVELQLEPQGVRLTQFVVRGGEGQLTGGGGVGIREYTIGDIDVTLKAERFRVIDTKEYRAAVEGQIVCSGSLRSPSVKGALKIMDAAMRPNLALMKSGPAAHDPTITVMKTASALPALPLKTPEEEEEGEEESAAAFGGLYNRLALQVDVAIPRETWVQMSEGSIEFRGDLRVHKEPVQALVVSGAIETVRGWLAVQGRKFRLEKGNMIFTGSTPIDPGLDVTARYTLPEYVVDVLIGGTAKAPTVTFTSEPNLEQADILALLVFGKPANALSDQQKTSLQSQALSAVAGSVVSELRQSLAEQLGVENLELDVGQSLSQSKVGIGKYVAPGVFVSTSQQFGGNSHGQGRDVTIEYQLNDNWQLKASTTSRGNNGIDIFWKKKY